VQAVLLRALNEAPVEQIARVSGLSVNTVRMLHSRYLREGDVFQVGRPGRGGRRRSHLSTEQESGLLARHVPAAGEGHMIQAHAFKRDYEDLVGHPVAATTVYRLLARAGWRKIVPRPSRPKKDPQAQVAFKKKFAGILAQEKARHGARLRVLFMDEGRFGRISVLRSCWAPASVRPRVPRQVVRESLYAFAAVCPLHAEGFATISPRCNTDAMSRFLLDLFARWPDERLLMFLDGAGWHQSPRLPVPERLRLELLPPCTP
jgi:transposase